MFFNRVINNSQHILETMLPVKRDSQYNLRTRTHDRLLIDKSADLNDCDFVVCMLYKFSYLFCHLCLTLASFNLVISCVCQLSIKNNDNETDRQTNRIERTIPCIACSRKVKTRSNETIGTKTMTTEH